MKPIAAMVGMGILAACAAYVTAGPAEDKLVAEMEKCAVCKSMAENRDLLKEMTWETHKIENGMLSVASVPKEHAKEFAALHAKMMKSVAQVEADQRQGKQVALCSFCEGMSELEKKGAKQEVIETQNGAISLVTSADPQIVAMIHEQADKAIAEQKQLKSPGVEGR